MIKDVFQNIDGIGIFPVISLILFMAIFIFIIVWIIRLKKEDIIEMKNIPLTDSVTGNKNNQEILEIYNHKND